MTSSVLNGQETHWLESQKKIVGSYVLTFNMGSLKKNLQEYKLWIMFPACPCNFFSRTEFLVYKWVTTIRANFWSFAKGTSFWVEARRNLSLPSQEPSLPSALHQLLHIYLTSWPVDADRSTPVAYSSRLEPEKSVGERKAHACAPVRVHPRLFS